MCLAVYDCQAHRLLTITAAYSAALNLSNGHDGIARAIGTSLTLQLLLSPPEITAPR